jgi:toxin ParE1/3/4
MHVVWTTLAFADLQEIYGYLNERNPGVAIKMVTLIRKIVTSQLTNSPFMGRSGRVQGTREIVIPHTPYLLIYRVVGDTLQILRVLHGAQEWPRTTRT